MVKRGGGLIYFCIQMRGRGVFERGLKRRGLNIEITVLHSFLSLPKHAAGEGATAGVKAWIARLMYCMLCTW
jgi:hypothetical protein